ncbi:MAG: SDR family NAD(P)-dependent oxidoreductase [Ktedonobacteraceae bacterium]|nr:SDR family NAD(P)-dependent oxidoreductase [Ktedonobacteraceae bacterium]
MAGKLHGKVALVTGASSGIGEATALALAAEGAYVALAARRVERLEAVVKRIEDSGGQAIAIIADVANEKQTQEMVQAAHTKWGHLDILVNNAGLMLLGPIEGADTEDWRRMVNVNLLGLMYATHAVLPIMKGQSGGHIVNISSVAGRTITPGNAVYNTTKWGVGAFSEALRQEVHAHHIRVTIIEPGVVETELVEHITDPKAKEETQQFYQAIHGLQSEDIAAAIVYAVTQPPHVSVNEILIRPTEQDR